MPATTWTEQTALQGGFQEGIPTGDGFGDYFIDGILTAET